MRTLKTVLCITLALMSAPCSIFAQDTKSQAYWIHEDVVKPSMVKEYEGICQELIANMKKHNIQEVNMITTNLVGDRYLYVGPIANMAQLDKPIFATLAEKMGGNAMGDLFNRMDKCYDTEQDYVLYLDKELSYMPTGITQTPVGMNYRKFHYYQYATGNRDVVKEKIKTIRNLFQKKGSKLEYRVYRSGFGVRGEYYMVAIAAQDAVDYATKIAANNELMGEEWATAYSDLLGSLLQYEAVEGQMRPDMAYSPSN